MEFRRSLAVVSSAACVASAFELLAADLRGAGHRSGYFLFSFLVSLGLAALVAIGAGALRRTPVQAVALWVAIAAGLVHGWLFGLATAVATLAIAPRSGARDVSDSRLGLVVGSAFAASSILAVRVGAGWPAPLTPGSAALLLFLVLLALGLGAARLLPASWRSRRLVGPALAGIVAFAALEVLRDAVVSPALPHQAPGPHVFVLVIDTVRADELSLYGYERDTTPRLAARVAANPGAAVYPWAFANGTWTAPSHATLLTGLLPSENDVHLGTPTAKTMDWSIPTRFALRADRTLAERFHDAGYATLAAFANPWLSRIDGLERGFDVYREIAQPGGLPLSAERLRQRFTPSWFLDVVDYAAREPAVARALLDEIDARPDRNLFVFANFLDVHAPYRPPSDARGRYAAWGPFEGPQRLAIDLPQAERDRLRARYDESLHAFDAALDEFLEALDARGILENAWVFVTSDHGEAFAEHGVTDHGTGVYNEIVRVPLVVLPPRGATLTASKEPVSLVSVAATLAAIAGEPLGTDADLRAGGPGSARIEFYADPPKARTQGALGAEPAQAFVSGSLKLIRYRERAELYDLAADPAERRDLSVERPEVVRDLAASLSDLGIERAGSATVEADDALRERLQALGYLEGQ